jgi:predicted O-methyltransferase YrrM
VNPYASHLPVLEAVTGLIRPRWILELGGGLHSTPFFLSLPIERLVSVETDETWREAIAKDCHDPRLRLHSGLSHLKRSDLGAFDLVFVDDGFCAEEREESIRWVLSQPHPPTVIHDAEVYATVIKELAPNYAVLPTKPGTAVIW